MMLLGGLRGGMKRRGGVGRDLRLARGERGGDELLVYVPVEERKA
jgi:hypothetical protein